MEGLLIAPSRKSPDRSNVTGYTPHQSTYLAYRITLEGRGEGATGEAISRRHLKPSRIKTRLRSSRCIRRYRGV